MNDKPKTASATKPRGAKRKCNVELLEKLYLDGVPVEEIANRVGLDQGASVSSWAKRLALPLRNERGVSDARDSAIYTAAKAGANRKDLAKQHGISLSTIHKAVQRLAREENAPLQLHQIKDAVIAKAVKPQATCGPLSCSPAAINRAMQARGIRP